jgi:very-short-patch-repair endonuclease
MDPRDFTLVARIRTTTPSRTLLDLASVLTFPELRRAVDRAERLEIFDGNRIESLLKRVGGRAGARGLRAAIAAWRSTDTKSELEDRFQELIGAAGIERPAINVQVEGRSDVHEVDCLWRDARLVVQLDGFTFHRTRGDRERDAATDTDIELAGYRVMRLTWNDVTKRADRSIERVSNAL